MQMCPKLKPATEVIYFTSVSIVLLIIWWFAAGEESVCMHMWNGPKPLATYCAEHHIDAMAAALIEKAFR